MLTTDVTTIVNYGVGPVVVIILILLGILVPKSYVTKLEKENELLRQNLELQKLVTQQAVEAAANSNQLIGALKEMVASGQNKAPPSSPPGG